MGGREGGRLSVKGKSGEGELNFVMSWWNECSMITKCLYFNLFCLWLGASNKILMKLKYFGNYFRILSNS